MNMRCPKLQTATLLAALGTAPAAGCEMMTAPRVPESISIPSSRTSESTRDEVSAVLTLTVDGRMRQYCDVAGDDPVLTEPLIEDPKLDCTGYLVSCEKAWNTANSPFPYRQLWPEVIENQRLSLFHEGQASLFSCADGSRMVADEINGNPGPIACLKNEYETVREKSNDCSSGRNEMVPVVLCDPLQHKKTVTWECAFDGGVLSDIERRTEKHER